MPDLCPKCGAYWECGCFFTVEYDASPDSKLSWRHPPEAGVGPVFSKDALIVIEEAIKDAAAIVAEWDVTSYPDNMGNS